MPPLCENTWFEEMAPDMASEQATEHPKHAAHRQKVPGRTPCRSVSLTLLALAVLTLSALGDNGVLKLFDVVDYRAELNEKKRYLMQENERLEAQLNALQHDDSYIEQVARGTLSLVREGETVYQFKETER